MSVSRNNRRSNASNLIFSFLPQVTDKTSEQFVQELLKIHENQYTPFNYLPTILGRKIDLLILYNEVAKHGGIKKMSDIAWEEAMLNLNIPLKCSNAYIALRNIYMRFVEPYERMQRSRATINELEEELQMDSDNSYAHSHHSSQYYSSGFHHHSHHSTNHNHSTRYNKYSSNLSSSFSNYSSAAFNSSNQSVMSASASSSGSTSNLNYYNHYYPHHHHHQHHHYNSNNTSYYPVNMLYRSDLHQINTDARQQHALSTQLAESHEMLALELSLCSRLDNELDLALNTLLILSSTPPSILSSEHEADILIKNPRLLHAMLNAIGICDSLSTQLYSEYDKKMSKYFRYWDDQIEDELARIFLHPNALDGDVSRDVVNAPDSTDSLMDLFNSSVDELSTNDIEGTRIFSVATILRNLTLDNSQNTVIVSRDVLALRFVVLCAHCKHSALRQTGLDILASIRMPIVGQLTEIIPQMLKKLIRSEDRLDRLRCLEIVTRLAHPKTAVDNLSMFENLAFDFYSSLIANTIVFDLHLVVMALDAMFALSELSKSICIRLLDSSSELLPTLHTLLSLEAQVMGSQSLFRIRVMQGPTQPNGPPLLSSPIAPPTQSQLNSSLMPPPPAPLHKAAYINLPNNALITNSNSSPLPNNTNTNVNFSYCYPSNIQNITNVIQPSTATINMPSTTKSIATTTTSNNIVSFTNSSSISESFISNDSSSSITPIQISTSLSSISTSISTPALPSLQDALSSSTTSCSSTFISISSSESTSPSKSNLAIAQITTISNQTMETSQNTIKTPEIKFYQSPPQNSPFENKPSINLPIISSPNQNNTTPSTTSSITTSSIQSLINVSSNNCNNISPSNVITKEDYVKKWLKSNYSESPNSTVPLFLIYKQLQISVQNYYKDSVMVSAEEFHKIVKMLFPQVQLVQLQIPGGPSEIHYFNLKEIPSTLESLLNSTLTSNVTPPENTVHPTCHQVITLASTSHDTKPVVITAATSISTSPPQIPITSATSSVAASSASPPPPSLTSNLYSTPSVSPVVSPIDFHKTANHNKNLSNSELPPKLTSQLDSSPINQKNNLKRSIPTLAVAPLNNGYVEKENNHLYCPASKVAKLEEQMKPSNIGLTNGLYTNKDIKNNFKVEKLSNYPNCDSGIRSTSRNGSVGQMDETEAKAFSSSSTVSPLHCDSLVNGTDGGSSEGTSISDPDISRINPSHVNGGTKSTLDTPAVTNSSTGTTKPSLPLGKTRSRFRNATWGNGVRKAGGSQAGHHCHKSRYNATHRPYNLAYMYICEWDNCLASFDKPQKVYGHVYTNHFMSLQTEVQSKCLWARCTDCTPRTPLPLLNHVNERHCNNVDLEAARQARLSNRTDLCSTTTTSINSNCTASHNSTESPQVISIAPSQPSIPSIATTSSPTTILSPITCSKSGATTAIATTPIVASIVPTVTPTTLTVPSLINISSHPIIATANIIPNIVQTIVSNTSAVVSPSKHDSTTDKFLNSIQIKQETEMPQLPQLPQQSQSQPQQQSTSQIQQQNIQKKQNNIQPQHNTQLQLMNTQIRQNSNTSIQQSNTQLVQINTQLQQNNSQLQQNNTQQSLTNSQIQQNNTNVQPSNTQQKSSQQSQQPLYILQQPQQQQPQQQQPQQQLQQQQLQQQQILHQQQPMTVQSEYNYYQQPIKEGPVTKHIRYVSAVVLRNLCRHCESARRFVSARHAQLFEMSISSCESARVLSECLFYSSNSSECTSTSSSTASSYSFSYPSTSSSSISVDCGSSYS